MISKTPLKTGITSIYKQSFLICPRCLKQTDRIDRDPYQTATKVEGSSSPQRPRPMNGPMECKRGMERCTNSSSRDNRISRRAGSWTLLSPLAKHRRYEWFCLRSFARTSPHQNETHSIQRSVRRTEQHKVVLRRGSSEDSFSLKISFKTFSTKSSTDFQLSTDELCAFS